MKSIGYSPSTTLAQGELLAFHMTQHLMNDEALQTGSKDEKFVPNQHLCIGVLPFDVMVDTLDISIQKTRCMRLTFTKVARKSHAGSLKK